MDISTAIVELIRQDGVAIAVLIFLAWFLSMRVWPFVTGVWWPASSARQQMQNTVLSGLADAVVTLKVISQQQMAMLAEHGQALNEILVMIAGRGNSVSVSVSNKDSVKGDDEK